MASRDFRDDSIIYDESNSRTVLKADSIVDDIVDQFIDRSRVGKLKYGVTLDRADLSLSEWLEHAIQEHMDAILYLKKIKTLIDGIK